MSRLTSVSLIALTSLSLALAGCQKKAEGQVVAVVNGEEITSNELNAEIAELNVPANADKTRVRAEVLQTMVKRRLLAQTAKDSGLDRDPTYVSQERRMKEQLLVSMYAKKTSDTVAVPDSAKVDQYIASHPTLFGGRTRYKLDQIVFDPPADTKKLQPLTGLHSMADIAAWLNKEGIKFQRGGNTMDSAGVPPDVMARIKALPAGEPFIVPSNGKVVASVITGSEPVVVPADQARPLAVQAIRREELNKIGEQRLKEAEAKAKIEYQKGYEPPKAPAAGAAATPAAK
ncbi:MAG TPA: EpsD family peptidyl-prolyl cis-trans isomerase [Sphingobium sp.]